MPIQRTKQLDESVHEHVICDQCNCVITIKGPKNDYTPNVTYLVEADPEGKEPFYRCGACVRKNGQPLGIDSIQELLQDWTLKQFSEEYPDHRLVVGAKHMGDLLYLHMKSARNPAARCSDEQVMQEKMQRIGDVALTLMTYCSDNRLQFFDVIDRRWKEIKDLNFQKYPNDGKTC